MELIFYATLLYCSLITPGCRIELIFYATLLYCSLIPPGCRIELILYATLLYYITWMSNRVNIMGRLQLTPLQLTPLQLTPCHLILRQLTPKTYIL